MKIAVAATFTAEPLEPSLRFWIEELQIPADIAFAPNGQLFQQLLDPSSVLARNRGGFNVLLVRLEDLAAGDPAAIERNTVELVGALESALRRSRRPAWSVSVPPRASPEKRRVFAASKRAWRPRCGRFPACRPSAAKSS